MKSVLHFGEAHASCLLFLANSLQLLPSLLFSNTWTLLPLLNTLWKNLVDSAAKPERTQTSSFCGSYIWR